MDILTEIEAVEKRVEDGKSNIAEDFVRHLKYYLESIFPTQTDLDSKVSNELRKYIKVGDGRGLKKARQDVVKVILKEKQKFLNTIEHRIAKIMVEPKIMPKDIAVKPTTILPQHPIANRPQ